MTLREDPLGEKLLERVIHLAGLTAVGAGVRLVKRGKNGAGKHVLEKNTLCRDILRLQNASLWSKVVSTTPFYHREAFLFSHFVNNPG